MAEAREIQEIDVKDGPPLVKMLYFMTRVGQALDRLHKESQAVAAPGREADALATALGVELIVLSAGLFKHTAAYLDALNEVAGKCGAAVLVTANEDEAKAFRESVKGGIHDA